MNNFVKAAFLAVRKAFHLARGGFPLGLVLGLMLWLPQSASAAELQSLYKLDLSGLEVYGGNTPIERTFTLGPDTAAHKVHLEFDIQLHEDSDFTDIFVSIAPPGGEEDYVPLGFLIDIFGGSKQYIGGDKFVVALMLDLVGEPRDGEGTWTIGFLDIDADSGFAPDRGLLNFLGPMPPAQRWRCRRAVRRSTRIWRLLKRQVILILMP